MLQIRRNVFETNSSSTHSLVMCKNDDYEALRNNEAFLVGCMHGDMDIVKKEDLLKRIDKWNKECWEEYCKEIGLNPKSVDHFANEILNGFDKADTDLMYEFFTLEQFWDNCEMETYHQTFKTKDGEVIHAFGCFGYDG